MRVRWRRCGAVGGVQSRRCPTGTRRRGVLSAASVFEIDRKVRIVRLGMAPFGDREVGAREARR
jgi:hypothetical protein